MINADFESMKSKIQKSLIRINIKDILHAVVAIN